MCFYFAKVHKNIKKKPSNDDFFAGEERFELPSMVLETTILPLNYSPKRGRTKKSVLDMKC